ncbi:MAG: lipid A biosynthesis acyltransferase [Gammaproteobacteria bacterium]|nr:lipid A biosynthesis acyltransferase [Gammaproteobacteria bacterium]
MSALACYGYWFVCPMTLQLRLGAMLGRLLHRLARERRRITAINIRLCFPELSAAEQARLVRAAFESYGMNVFETATAWLRGVEHLRDRAEINGIEHIKAAQAQGRGVLIIGAHFSTIDISGALVEPYLAMDVIYRPSRNPVFDRLIRQGRGRYFGAVLSKEDTRGIIRDLREGRAIWYAADQNYARRHSVFAPFFGTQAATIRGTSRLVSMTGAVAVFCSHFRLDGGRRYRVDFSPVLEDFPSSSEVEDATRINQMIETALADHPEQYLWLHRRFKTRPEGEPEVY